MYKNHTTNNDYIVSLKGGLLWHSLLIHRQIINSPVISTVHVMLISSLHGDVTCWYQQTMSCWYQQTMSCWFQQPGLNMTMQWTKQGRPLRGRPCVVNKIVMFSPGRWNQHDMVCWYQHDMLCWYQDVTSPCSDVTCWYQHVTSLHGDVTCWYQQTMSCWYHWWIKRMSVN